MGADHRSAAGPGTMAVTRPGASTPPTGSAVEQADPGPPPGLFGLARRRVTAFPYNRNDLLIALACAAADAASYTAAGRIDGPYTIVLSVLLPVVGGALLIVRRRYPLYVLAGVVALHLALSLTVTVTTHNSGLTFCVALYTVARTRDHRTIGIAAAGVLVGQAVRTFRSGESIPVGVSVDAMLIVMVIAIAIWVRRWQDQVALNRRLLADRAVTEERRRIARELHDIVAHHITTMYLMSGGARATLDREPETARAALFTLESSGRTALREMRQLLGVLRSTDVAEEAPSEPQPGIHEIDRLITESRAAGLPTEYEEFGTPRPVPLTIELTLYRIVQEALTNARKHAGHARAFVRLEYRPDRVAVEIRDDGDGGGGAAAIEGGGYGLLGMRERVAVHGGTLEVGRQPEGGYRVAAIVPLPPQEPGEEWN
ncbi:sensor histidine kinase [Embleya sp. NBC_00896]|uniref:sensor histidine kinase n=1 Tax=Embleya sp. NBC_00896 TaxID=2975961 RepID=UPI003867F117|nr:histidine kinase [Embleya sp. NBC_00896]